MIALTVLSYNGVPAEPLCATFDELGGTIGRSDNNQLVLADPERTISRVHARIVFRASGFAIVDNGSNPIVVNGHPVGSGREHPLTHGDEVQIGGYLLKVGPAGGVPASDPFAELFGDAPMGLAGPAAPAPAVHTGMASPAARTGMAAPSGHASWGAPPSPAPSPARLAPASTAPAWPAASAAPAWPAPAPSAPGGGATFGASSGAAAIPDDWDPFAPESPASAASPSRGADPFGAALPASTPAVGSLGVPGSESSLDDLFGLGPAPAAGGGDLLAALAAPTPAARAAAAAPAPGEGFGFDEAFDPAFDKPRHRPAPPPAHRGSLPDHVSDLNTPMVLPGPETTARVRATPATLEALQAMAAPPPPSAASDTQPALVPQGAILSWEDPPRDGKVVTLPGIFVAATTLDAGSAPAAGPLPTDFGLDLDFDIAPAPAPASTPLAAPRSPVTIQIPATSMPSMSPVLPEAPAPQRAGREAGPGDRVVTSPFARPLSPVASGPAAPPQPVSAPPAQAAARASAPPVAADAERLQQAFARGLGVPGLRLNDLDPAQMELLGQVMREAVRGAVELLIARAAFKRELRAEMTMIVARENNPLKFSPTVEVALQHLLGTPTPGFMAPATAMRDAFDDLRAHQLGVMAGMRAALEGVLGRFDPQQLEGKLTRKSALDSLLPSGRKARLWELFQELFQQLQREAQDDFDELFGRAFLQAYEAQLDRLHGEPGPR